MRQSLGVGPRRPAYVFTDTDDLMTALTTARELAADRDLAKIRKCVDLAIHLLEADSEAHDAEPSRM